MLALPRRCPPQESEIAAIDERSPSPREALHAKAQIVGMGAPLPLNPGLAEQPGCDVAMARAGAERIKHANNQDPARDASVGGKEIGWQAAEAPQGDESAQRHELVVQLGNAFDQVAQADWTVEQRAARYIEANRATAF